VTEKYIKLLKSGTRFGWLKTLPIKQIAAVEPMKIVLSNVSKYGYLYDWEAAQNVCPTG
jgi:hypothetical protein